MILVILNPDFIFDVAKPKQTPGYRRLLQIQAKVRIRSWITRISIWPGRAGPSAPRKARNFTKSGTLRIWAWKTNGIILLKTGVISEDLFSTIVVEETREIEQPSVAAEFAEKIVPRFEVDLDDFPKKRLGKVESPFSFMAVNNYSHNLSKVKFKICFQENLKTSMK